MFDHYAPVTPSHQNRQFPGVKLATPPFDIPPATIDESSPYDRRSAMGYTLAPTTSDTDTDDVETLIDALAMDGVPV